MCDPVSITMAVSSAAISMAGTVASAKQASDAAKRQRQAAIEANTFNQAQLSNRQQELADKGQLDKFERMRQQWRDEAKIMTSAAEGGVVGGSITAMLHENELGAAYDLNIINKSKDINMAQTNAERIRSANQSQSMINEADSRAPSALTSGLNMIGAGLQGGAAGYSMGQQVNGLWGGGGASKDLYIPHRTDGLH